MGFRHSYFALGDLHPIRALEHMLHPFHPMAELQLRGHPLRIFATHRAVRALAKRISPLQVEMQLYFSCVVKKRVLFHEEGEHAGESVSDKLSVDFRAVEALACDPVAFAANHPERRQLTSAAARKMHPSQLCLDYRKDMWYGDFKV